MNDVNLRLQEKLSGGGYFSNSEATQIVGWVNLGNPKFNSIFGAEQTGIPLGRVIGVIGGESHGKSATAYWIAAKCQQAGGVVFLADEEAAFQSYWSEKFGVVPSDIIHLTTGTKEVKGKGGKVEIEEEGLEDLLAKFELAALTMRVDFPDTPALIIWDSIAATPTRRELGEDYDNQMPAETARVLSRGLKKLNKILVGSKVSLLYINQLRAKIGGFGPVTNTQPGGRALRYYSAIIAEVAKTGTRSGYITCKVRNKKNKIAPPFIETNFKINFEEGLVI